MGKYSDWAAGKAASMKAVGATLTDEEAVQHTDFFMPWRMETEYHTKDHGGIGDAAFGRRKRKTAYGYVWEVAQ